MHPHGPQPQQAPQPQPQQAPQQAQVQAQVAKQDRELRATDRYIAVATVRITVPIFIGLLVFAALPVFNDRFSEADRSPKRTDGRIIALCYASAMLALLSTSTAAVNLLGVHWYLSVDSKDHSFFQYTFVPAPNVVYDLTLAVNDLIFISALITLVIALNDRFSEADRSPKRTDGRIIALCYASAMLALLSTSTAAVNLLGVHWYLSVDSKDHSFFQYTFVPAPNVVYDLTLAVNDLIFISALITLVIALMTFVWNELELESARNGILAAALIGGLVWVYLLLYALTALGCEDPRDHAANIHPQNYRLGYAVAFCLRLKKK